MTYHFTAREWRQLTGDQQHRFHRSRPIFWASHLKGLQA